MTQLDPELTPTDQIEALIAELANNATDLTDRDTTEQLVVDGTTASRVLEAANQAGTFLRWAGQITTDWKLPDLEANLTIVGSVSGDLNIDGSVGGDLRIRGSVGGDLNIGKHHSFFGSGSIGGNLRISESGSVGGNLNISGSVGRDLRIRGSIGRDLNIFGSVGRHLRIRGSIGGDGSRPIGGSVGGDLNIFGSVGRDLRIRGSIGGELLIFGSVGRDFHIFGSVGRGLRIGGILPISGSVGGDLRIFGSGSVGGNLRIEGTGSVGGNLSIEGTVDGRTALTPQRLVRLVSTHGARFAEEVYVGDQVQIQHCDFRQCQDLNKFALVGVDLFSEPNRFVGPKLTKPSDATDAEMASVYRQLRTNLEGRGNRPGAAVFYRGEMRSRFWAALRSIRLIEAIVIGAYWLMSGFGLSAWRPVVAFGALAVVAGQAFIADGALGGVGPVEGIDAIQFAVQSMVSFVRPPSPPDGAMLDRNEVWLQLALRFFGPLLLAQFALALRDRVAR